MGISGTGRRRKKCHSWVREGGEKLFFFSWSSKNTSSPWSLMHSTYKEHSCIYIWLHLLREALGLQACRLAGPTWVTGISRLTFWLKKIMAIFLKTWGLTFILLVRSMPLQGGRGELLSSSPPAPVGGIIYKTLPSRAQHTQTLRRSHFHRNPRGKKWKSMKSKSKNIQGTHLTGIAGPDPTEYLDSYLLLVLMGWYK